jgi:Subtilase family/Fervidolysin N-terminal prodomain
VRWNNSDTDPSAERTRLLARLALVLTATVAVFALATAAHAQRMTPLGSSGGRMTTGPLGGSPGIINSITSIKPGKGSSTTGPGTRFPGVTTLPPGKPPGITGLPPGGKPGGDKPGGKGGGTIVGDGRPGGTGPDRPSKPPRWTPPVHVSVPVVTGVTAATVATPAISAGSQKISKGPSNPQFNNPGSQPSPRSQGFRRDSGVPPAGEQRYVPDEVLIQLTSSTTSGATADALARQMGLNWIESYTSNGVTMFRGRIPDGRSVSTVIRSLEAAGFIARPNYLYMTLQQRSAPDAQQAAATSGTTGVEEQYALAKLRLPQAHALAKGEKILIAVIDSGVDTTHPELAGMVEDSFDALKSDEKAHTHGTAVAGAIVARARLIGAAPEARVLAARAFSAKKASVEATTYSIRQSLDWAMERGARIINMSFTGPRDPSLEEKMGQARQKGIVLIAAAGNGGPSAPKAYPAAYPNVIAVTATDAEDKLFKGANRGGYIAVAAPGVDLLLPAPELGYQVTTGTSFSAAEVSGVVALMLERKPDLTPDGVRKALTATARDLGPTGVDIQFGAGLVDAYQAIRSLDPAIAATGAKVNPAPIRTSN